MPAETTATDVSLRDAARPDCRFVYEVNAHPSVRAQAIDRSEIDWDDHCAWFTAKLDDASTHLWIASADDEDIGVVRFDVLVGLAVPTAEVTIALSPNARGRGLGTQTLDAATRALADRHGIARVVALIRPGNEASRRAFERAGYVHEGATKRRDVELVRYVWSASSADTESES